MSWTEPVLDESPEAVVDGIARALCSDACSEAAQFWNIPRICTPFTVDSYDGHECRVSRLAFPPGSADEPLTGEYE
ncbi:hypothetical protein WJ438_17610 [Streptomyces sp. GD-15H]|uniref:hypothetical protein n=1 Tax=Streptomyces sp. GD-15H TaxID=3129112 RepID=UPI003249F2B3